MREIRKSKEKYEIVGLRWKGNGHIICHEFFRVLLAYLINTKRPEFVIFCHLYRNMVEDKEKFHGFFRMNIEQFHRLSQLVGEEIRKQNTKYRRAISPEERLAIFKVLATIICRRQERDSRYYWSYPFSSLVS